MAYFGNRNVLTVFKGKAKKPYYHYIVGGDWSDRQRQWDKIKKRHLEDLKAKEIEKKKIEKLRKSWKNPYKYGDLLYTSWGYEQTNVNFYQVVEVNAKSLVLREVSCFTDNSEWNSGYKTPIKDRFIRQKFIARIVFSRSLGVDGNLIHSVVNKKIAACSDFYFWDGKPVPYSAYY